MFTIEDLIVNCTSEPPSIEFLEDIKPYGIVILCIETAILICSWLFLLEMYLYVRHVSTRERSTGSILIVLALYPIFILASYISVVIPRTSSATMPASSIYLSFVLSQLIYIMEKYYGGRRKFFQVMSKQQVSLVGFPICFCLCLPTITMTRKNIYRLRLGIYQYVILRPLLYYVMLLLQSATDVYPTRYDKALPYVYLIITVNMSTIIAMYSIGIFTNAIKDHFPDDKVPAKLFCIRAVLLTTIFQETILSMLTSFNVIPCLDYGPMASHVRALWINNNLLIFELFLLLLLLRYLYRSTRGVVSAEFATPDGTDNGYDVEESVEKTCSADDDIDMSADEGASLIPDSRNDDWSA